MIYGGIFRTGLQNVSVGLVFFSGLNFCSATAKSNGGGQLELY